MTIATKSTMTRLSSLDDDEMEAILSVMRRQEASHRQRFLQYQKHDSSSASSTSIGDDDATPPSTEVTAATTSTTSSADELSLTWRSILIDWMYFIVDYCNFEPSVVGLAAELWDVCCAMPSSAASSSPQFHQLAAATCLQLSLKVLDTGALQLDRLVQLGKGAFTEDNVVVLEMALLRHCCWNVSSIPTVYCFVEQYKQHLGSATSTDHLDQLLRIILQVAVLEQGSSSAEDMALACVELALPQSPLSPSQHQACIIKLHQLAKMGTATTTTTAKVKQRLEQALQKDAKRWNKFQEILSSSKNVTGLDGVSSTIPKATITRSSSQSSTSPREVVELQN